MKKELMKRSLDRRLRVKAFIVCLLLLATMVIGCDANKTTTGSDTLVNPTKDELSDHSDPSKVEQNDHVATLVSPAKVKPIGHYSELPNSFRKALWDFAFKTSGLALTVKGDENALYSPISLYYALAMVEAGAGGQTKADLRTVLELTGEMDAGAALQKLYSMMLHDGTSEELVANAVWMRLELGDQVSQEWLDQLASHFYASAFKVDFNDKATAETMSKWVEEQTRGKIKPEIDLSEADMILMNTLYFKADWASAFEEVNNRQDFFYTSLAIPCEVTFMNAKYDDQEYLVADEFRASAIKLKNGKIDFILPNEGVLPETLLANPDFLKLVYEGKRQTANVVFSIPKFSYRVKIDVFEKMEALGLRDMLQNKPDFSVMLPAQKAEVSKITQEAFIDLNEQGVEAAAYTEIAMRCTSVPIQDDFVEMIFNRPFIYVISDDAGVPLFVGVINNPLKE
ncbi:MAG TPA: serpin family protein [Clostridiaceae bacterium]|nr:serpin family protein [Clostridiaceae bacterium]